MIKGTLSKLRGYIERGDLAISLFIFAGIYALLSFIVGPLHIPYPYLNYVESIIRLAAIGGAMYTYFYGPDTRDKEMEDADTVRTPARDPEDTAPLGRQGGYLPGVGPGHHDSPEVRD